MNEPALRVLNDSGFPLQVAIHRAIDESQSQTGWRVRYSEHAWKEVDGPRSGFIDLVVVNAAGNIYVAVECKRVRDTEWIFMHSDGRAARRSHAQVWLSQFQNEQFIQYGWSHLQVLPLCPEVQFCAIRGQSSADKTNLLERTAADLINSTEALAREHRDIRRKETLDVKAFLSIIVTTANLRVARFDPSTVSLNDGTLPTSDFEDVPFVRLRKQLGVISVRDFSPDEVLENDLAYLKESTVFVVHATAIARFLSELEISGKAA